MRLIDADALDEILKDLESRYNKWLFYISAKAVANVRKIVYAMKTVDAVPVVHGHWIEHLHFNYDGEYSGSDYECSCCGFNDVYDTEDYNYCPHCGAKLDGDEDD
jgi:hypothetical protein